MAEAAEKKRKGPPDGIHVDHDTEGRPRMEYTIVDGKLDGEARFYAAGELTQIGMFSAGLLHGENRYYKDGEVTMLTNHRRGKLHGEYVEYSGGLVSARHHFEKGVLNGPTEFYKDGQLAQRTIYVDGFVHGDTVFYDDNGDVQQIVPFHRGRKEGLSTIYEKGRRLIEVEFRNDLQDGWLTTFSPANRPMARIPYKDGKKHGEARYYDMDGHVVKRETFVAGRLEGPAFEMMPDGTVLKEYRHHEDKLHGWMIEYSHKGKETFRQEFRDGEPVGAKLEKTTFGHKEVEESEE